MTFGIRQLSHARRIRPRTHRSDRSVTPLGDTDPGGSQRGAIRPDGPSARGRRSAAGPARPRVPQPTPSGWRGPVHPPPSRRGHGGDPAARPTVARGGRRHDRRRDRRQPSLRSRRRCGPERAVGRGGARAHPGGRRPAQRHQQVSAPTDRDRTRPWRRPCRRPGGRSGQKRRGRHGATGAAASTGPRRPGRPARPRPPGKSRRPANGTRPGRAAKRPGTQGR